MKIVRSFFAQIFGGVKYIMYLCHHENETPVSLKSILREMDAPRIAEYNNNKLLTELLKQMTIMEIPNNQTSQVAAQQYRMKS